MKQLRNTHCLLLLPLLCCCLHAEAATVYKSIDENGAVSFSDTPPTDQVLVETVVIEEQVPPSSELTQQRLEDMRATTDRMVADRMAREKHRAELRQIDAQRDARTAPPQELDTYYDTPFIYTGNVGNDPYGPRQPWRRPNHPVHPIAKPPLLPPAQNYTPDFDYPAKLIRKSYDPRFRAVLR